MTNQSLFSTRQPLILASASPRRQKMLHKLGIEFTVSAAHIDETPHPHEKPDAYVRRMAATKAFAIAERNPTAWVIGADTVVCLGDTILGKPRDRNDALTILRQLAGRTHAVVTGICLFHGDRHTALTQSDRTEVTFTAADDALLKAYISSGEPLDKAGGYGIQGMGSFLVRSIKGSCSNVIGLPMDLITRLLLQQGIIAPLPEKKTH